MEARPMVTAGFKCAPLKAPTAYTATATPNAHPAVMTIHPLFWPLVLLSTTLATTPSPSMTNSMVPSTSARNGGIGLDEEAAKLSARQRLVYTRLERRRHSPQHAPPDHRAVMMTAQPKDWANALRYQAGPCGERDRGTGRQTEEYPSAHLLGGKSASPPARERLARATQRRCLSHQAPHSQPQ